MLLGTAKKQNYTWNRKLKRICAKNRVARELELSPILTQARSVQNFVNVSDGRSWMRQCR